MNCIFCKKNSDLSKSVEHIVPQSLGNIGHVLPKGIVCDKCNNFFSIKIEKDVLEDPYFKSLRSRNRIESKKKRIPIEKGIMLSPTLSEIELITHKNQNIINIKDVSQIDKIKSCSTGSFIIPIFEKPNEENLLLSRFLAKMALEALVYRGDCIQEWIEEILNHKDLDLIRFYARYGDNVKFWPYNMRRLYSESMRFSNPEVESEPYEIIHEFTFINTKEKELYFVIAIMGIEYVINLGEPSLEGYYMWLNENNNKSILKDDNERTVANTRS